MMRSFILPTLIFLSALISCNKEIKAEKGGIDIISNVYFGASKDLEKMQSFHVSRINYSGDTIVEIVPDLEVPEINSKTFLIKDTLYYDLGENSKNTIFTDILLTGNPHNVFKKQNGAIFSKDAIPNYHKRKNLADTILFNKNYKRFEVNSPQNYSRFYVYKTDTILPYALYKQAGKDYKGRIERIDSYNKEKDIFVSIQLLPRKEWDEEAKEIFQYNHFLNKRKK